MNETLIDMVNHYLDDYSVEDLLEEFDIDPAEAVVKLYYAGMIDDDDISRVFDLEEEDE